MSKVYTYITDLILERLAAGTVPWRRSWAAGLAPINLVSRKPYRGINCLLLAMTTYESPQYVERVRPADGEWAVIQPARQILTQRRH